MSKIETFEENEKARKFWSETDVMKIIEVIVRFPKIITAEETVRMEVPGDVEDIKGYLKDEGRCELGARAGIPDDVARDQIEILSVRNMWIGELGRDLSSLGNGNR